MSGKLYIVATPIGNLSDMTERAWKILSEVDFIAAEDTRVSIKLLNHHGISKPMVSYFEHNKRDKGQTILSRILSGENCALVSDAGTPAISDPGEDLCALCAENGVEIVPIPGVSAVIAALSASGFASGRFAFEGFLSVNKKSRREHLLSVKNEQRTMIFYEAPHKLKATLKDMFEALGDRKICIARELTKIHEQFLRFTLSEAITYFETVPPKGEFVLIISGYSGETESSIDKNLQAENYALGLIKQGYTHAEAVKTAAKKFGTAKGTLYKKTLEMLDKSDD